MPELLLCFSKAERHLSPWCVCMQRKEWVTCPKGTFSGPLFNPLDPDTQIKMRHGGFKHGLCLVLWAAAQWARSPARESESAQPSGGAPPASPWLLPRFHIELRPVSSPGLLGGASTRGPGHQS